MDNAIFKRTGLYIDLRIQVIRPDALCKIADALAAQGHNTLIIEWEASFPFQRHETICNRYAYSREEVGTFIAHCEGLGITVIPLQQCFGHLEYILRHPRYAHLREDAQDFSQLCPCKGEEAVALFADLFGEIVAAHPSPFFHLGGDETRLLGRCQQCRKVASEVGISRLYVDYFKRIAQEVTKLGKRPVFWADMLLKHPEAAADMPEDSVFMDWNYGWPIDQFGDIARLRKIVTDRGFELWGAPALRCHPDDHSLTSWETHFNNLRDYPAHAKANAYSGLITTSWSTSGTYTYIRDPQGALLELAPIRRVYPLNGFTILLDAFTAAVGQARADEPFVPEAFVKDYGQQRYGLSAVQSQLLWEALCTDATVAAEATDVEALLEQVQKTAEIFARLEAVDHLPEFEHLHLMVDLRAFHVRVVALTRQLENAQEDAQPFTLEATQVTTLLKEEAALNERFLQLNAPFLLTEELGDEIAYRATALQTLIDLNTRLQTAATGVR